MEIDSNMEAEMHVETIEIQRYNSTDSSQSSTARRFGIRNTIHTNFGDDYIFQIASSEGNSTLAVSLSSNVIKLYSTLTGQYFGECVGHRGKINEMSFAIPNSPNLICSCSSDATIRAWDTRTFKQVSSLKAGSYQEIFSFSFGGSSDNLLAAGCNAQIMFWDWRNGKQVACLEDSHMDDVTQVRFVPDQQNKLLSASVDGLICLFDTNGKINDYNHLETVMNVGTSIAKVGFFGQRNQKIWCLTHIETLSIWDWNSSKREVNFEDARKLTSDQWNLDNVDYFVDCHYSTVDDGLWVVGGTGSGTLGYFPVRYRSSSEITIGSPEAILEGGHTGVVRTVLPVSNIHGKGIFSWSGGEDGRLCCWMSDELGTNHLNRSWIASSLVAKSPRSRGLNRHHPY